MVVDAALAAVKAIGLGKILAGVLAVGLVGGLGYLLLDARGQVREYSLQADSLAAVADTTRLVAADTWERRAIQAEIERDDLDRELRQERLATVETEVVVDTVYVETESDSVDVLPDGTRHALFNTYQQPIRANIEVWLPEPPREARMEMSLAMDPVPLSLDVTCSESVFDGNVRRAMFRAHGPEWADIRVSTGTVDPTVCSPTMASPDVSFSFKRNMAKPVLVGAAQGAAIVALMDSRLEGSASTEDYLLGAGVSAAISFLVNLLPW